MHHKDVPLPYWRWRITRPTTAFSLVEMLVVISIVGVLMAMLFPALQAARVAGRQVACKNNLRQFGIAMHEHAIRGNGQFCSGAFDWRHDGCVTETGWVADMVQSGVPVGTMLCPGNPHRLTETYNDLLDWNAMSDGCVDLVGSEEQLAPDGLPIMNPCRRIVETPLAAGSAERTALVERLIYGCDPKGRQLVSTVLACLVRIVMGEKRALLHVSGSFTRLPRTWQGGPPCRFESSLETGSPSTRP
jgi:prepilin-type N-terminal cleavage/methylation domain-containing protein